MIASEGEKPLLYATRTISLDDFERLRYENNNFEEENTREVLENDLTLVACFGLVDKLREEVVDVINDLHEANTNTRILSGDHRETVFAIAKELGVPNENAISGEEFREQV